MFLRKKTNTIPPIKFLQTLYKHKIMKKHLFLLLFLMFLFACSGDYAKIKEETKTFPTYAFSDPNLIAEPDRNYYPYFRFDGYSQIAESKEWKVVELENRYIKVSVLPEIGGKVWGAVEKSTNNEFIYYNSVVKFRNIAMRGPWVSGGIEFNFGIIGHAPTTATPVDYSFKKNKDGSVSCFVGSLDLLTRIRWETEINLESDKAYFTTKTSYINPMPIIQPYYQWSNAAFSAKGNPELNFPGNHRIGHGGEANSWPVDENGILLSLYENNNFGDSKSYHIMGRPEGFFSAYWHDLNFGGGHYSPYGEKLGKKIFLWSQARSGGIWEDLLTDTDGQYIELQSGRLFNQASRPSTKTPFTHFGFQPYTTDTFMEYWYPILNTEGVLKANNFGVLNIKKEESQQTIYFSPLQRIKGNVSIYFGEKLKQRFKINVNPLHLWTETIELNSSNEPLKIIFGNDKFFTYYEEEDNLYSSKPVVSPGEFDWNSTFGLYKQGVNLLYQGYFEEALDTINECLKSDPYFTPALNIIGELYLRKFDNKNALNAAKKSLSINTYDPEANFIFAQASRNTRNLTDAYDGFAVASISPKFRTASYIELTKLFISKEEYFKAKEYVEKVLSADQNNQEALLLMSIIQRKNNLDKESQKYIDRLKDISPLNHFARFENSLIHKGTRLTKDFIMSIKTELAYQTLLEMALYYEYLNCREETIKLLELSPENVLADFKLASLYNIDGNKEKAMFYLNRGIEKPIDFVLPFRHELIQVLEWVKANTDNWKAKYYLGLLHWSLGNKITAENLFSACSNTPDSPYFYLTKANLFKNNNQYDAEQDLLRAKKLSPKEWRSSLALLDYYLQKNRIQEALDLSKESMINFPKNSQIQFNHAKSLLANNLFQDCFNVLEKTVILPYEGSQSGRILYRQAAVMQSLQRYQKKEYNEAISFVEKARIWPENLGVGKPYNPDQRIEDFLEAEYLMKTGNEDKARELYNNIISFTQNRNRFNSTDLLYLLTLKQLCRNEEINDFLTNWENQSTNKDILKWVKQALNSNRYVEYSTDGNLQNKSGGTPWDPNYIDSEFVLVKEILKHIRL